VPPPLEPTMGDWIGPDEPAPKPRRHHVGKVKPAPTIDDRPMKGMEIRVE